MRYVYELFPLSFVWLNLNRLIFFFSFCLLNIYYLFWHRQFNSSIKKHHDTFYFFHHEKEWKLGIIDALTWHGRHWKLGIIDALAWHGRHANIDHLQHSIWQIPGGLTLKSEFFLSKLGNPPANIIRKWFACI